MTREQKLDWQMTPVEKFNHVNGTNIQSWDEFVKWREDRRFDGAGAMIGAAYITPSAFESFRRDVSETFLAGNGSGVMVGSDPAFWHNGERWATDAKDPGVYKPRWEHTGESAHDLDAAGNCRDPRCDYNSEVEWEKMKDYGSDATQYAFGGTEALKADLFHQEMAKVAEEEAMDPTRLRSTVYLGPAGQPGNGFPTEASRRIFSESEERASLLQGWAELFMEKQQDYGDRGNDLGIPGQYAEMSRKFIKLRKAMWEGKPLVGEPVHEVIQDLIGHCFLTLKYLEDNNFGGKGDVRG